MPCESPGLRRKLLKGSILQETSTCKYNLASNISWNTYINQSVKKVNSMLVFFTEEGYQIQGILLDGTFQPIVLCFGLEPYTSNSHQSQRWCNIELLFTDATSTGTPAA
ncbi:hypothetical protein MAR_037903 [Mya arenaria]|uniref:Uncharacterized protein n=1 Tax=Mya arenaria TaxID=6604 RepID=A0ABY7FSX6_MYAAR|nr:hypothetical protein MAR_037903 [Mya arenaria]